MSSVPGGWGHHHHAHGHSKVDLTPAEQAAARKALASLGADRLLTGDGSDTFAGGVAHPGSFIASFASDSVRGGYVLRPHEEHPVSLSAHPFGIAGPTVFGMSHDSAPSGAGQVVAFSDQTTVNLIGFNHGQGSSH